jgi:hypothetical protein
MDLFVGAVQSEYRHDRQYPPRRSGDTRCSAPGAWPAVRGVPVGMFFFFSSRLGCLGSLLVSALLTGLVILVLYTR